MKRLFLLAMFVVVAFYTSVSQHENFDISKYKLPEMKRHQMDLMFNSWGNSSHEKRVLPDVFEDVDTLKAIRKELNGRSNVDYQFYRNSEKMQSFLEVRLNGSFLYDKEERNFYAYKNSEGNLSGNLDLNYNLKYFFRNKWFLTSVPEIAVGYQKYRSKQNNSHEEKYNSYYTDNSVSLGFGKGRIEQVQDFRQAILLLNELAERGALTRNAGETEIYELAQLMSQLKNKRFFDYRKRKEHELASIDSFLTVRGLVTDKDVSYFFGMEDMWNHGALQVRESGNQFQLTVKPGYYFREGNTSIENNKWEFFSLNYNLRFESKKPVSLKWQKDFYAGINHDFQKQFRHWSDTSIVKMFNSQIYARNKFSYYPNTRTQFSVYTGISLQSTGYDKFLHDETYSFSANINASAYYYINERLRLNFNIGASQSYYDIFYKQEKSGNRTTLNYAIAFNYALF
jgi:hypothetical protein